jgi:hypothetical protein
VEVGWESMTGGVGDGMLLGLHLFGGVVLVDDNDDGYDNSDDDNDED